MATARLRAELRGDSSQFRGELNKAGATVQQFKGLAQSVAPQLVGIFSIAGITQFIASGAAAADQMLDAGKIAGTTTEEFQRLFSIAETGGVTMDKFAAVLFKVRVAQGAIGTDKAATDAFRKLFPDDVTAKAASMTDILLRMGQALRENGDAATVNSIADIVGVRNIEMLAEFTGELGDLQRQLDNAATNSDLATARASQLFETFNQGKGIVRRWGIEAASWLDTITTKGALAAVQLGRMTGMIDPERAAKMTERGQAALNPVEKQAEKKSAAELAAKADSVVDERGLKERQRIEADILDMKQKQANIGRDDALLANEAAKRAGDALMRGQAFPVNSKERLESEREYQRLLLEATNLQQKADADKKRSADQIISKQQQLADLQFDTALRSLTKEEQVVKLKEKQLALVAQAAALEKSGNLGGALDAKIEAEQIGSRIDSLQKTGGDSRQGGIEVIASELARVGGVGASAPVISAAGDPVVREQRETNTILREVKAGIKEVRDEVRNIQLPSGSTYQP